MEIDAIGEILNISLGASATAVSNMLDARVDITTPIVHIQSRDEFEFNHLEPAVGVEIVYIEGLTGSNIMLLKRKDVRIIVEMLMDMEIKEEDFELDEMNISAICEVMNQMMGASATALSELLGRTVNISTPESLEIRSLEQFKDKYFKDENEMAVIGFTLRIAGRMESEFMNLMPIDLAKELVSVFFEDGVPDADETFEEAGPAPVPESTALQGSQSASAREQESFPAGVSDGEGAQTASAHSQSVPENDSGQEPMMMPVGAAPGQEPAAAAQGQETGAPGGNVFGQEPMMPGGNASGQETGGPGAAAQGQESATPGGDAPKQESRSQGEQFSPNDQSGYPQSAAMPVQNQAAAQQSAMDGQLLSSMAGMMDLMHRQLEAQQQQMQHLQKMQQQPKKLGVNPAPRPNLAGGQEEPATLEEQEANMELIKGVPLDVSVEIGRTKKLVKDILELNKGSLVVLDKLAGEQVDLFVNGQCIAKGDVVVVNDNFGIRITEIVTDEIPLAE